MPRGDIPVMVALTAGFAAFSVPLLWHDLGFWKPKFGITPSPPDHAGDHGYSDEHYKHIQNEADNELSNSFRQYVSEGDIKAVQNLYNRGLQEKPPVVIITKEH